MNSIFTGLFHGIQLLNFISGAYWWGFSGKTGFKGFLTDQKNGSLHLSDLQPRRSVRKAVSKAVQLVRGQGEERGTQGCGGDGWICSCSFCMCSTGTNATLLAGEQQHLAVTLNWSSWGWGGNSLLVVGSCTTVGKCFSLCALFFQLCHEGGSFACVSLFILFMLHFCIWKCFLNCECSAYSPAAVMNQVIDDYKIKQKKK